jgi:hypothetical protein
MDNSVLLEKVERELARYEHLLVRFSVRESPSWGMELVIELRQPLEGAHVYASPLHPRDVEHPQFPWTFQKYLYDCLHDYLVEMFTRNPQMLEGRR